DWEFGDGEQASDGVNPVSHEYQTEGEYTILLKAQFDNGCLRKETKSWSVYPTPQADFDLPAYSPINKPVALTSTSLPETVSCHWSVDADNYTVADASHIFTTAGTHPVRLVVTSPEGCTDTIERSTEVLDKPVADFDVVVDSCAGKVSITNKSVRHNATVAWDFGNGESVSSTWEPSERTYPLVWRDTLYTIRLTLANVSDTVECARTFKMFSRLEPDFEIWTSEPCNKADKEIRILTRGRADTTYVDWGDGSQPQMWLLSNPVNVLEHSYPENLTTASVDYRIKLRSTNTCHRPNAVEKGVSVAPLQVRTKVLEADELAEYKNKCYGNDRGFWNKSFGFISQGYTCEWNFGDGTPLETDTVSIEPKAHLFARPGEYVVRLRVKDECNEVLDSLKVFVHGNDSLDFAFGKDQRKLCSGDSVRIWLVQRGKEPFTNLRWTLPDGSQRKDVDTIYWKFKEAGTWQVNLSAEADGCKENPLPKACLVQQTPEPLIDRSGEVKTEGCTPLEVPFRVTNVKGSSVDVNTFWDFGEGSSSIEVVPPVMVFDSAGRYMVKVSMTSSNGCVGWDSIPVTARITPETALELEQRLVCSNNGDFEITVFNRTAFPDSCTFEWYKGNEVVSMDPVSVTIPFAGFHGREEIALRAVHKRTQCAYKVSD
ncbi:MAG: PKD domain-containing protein, partial [Odoribacter sp.]|nr:PKD domain-containing protein [Odoribacter sp.]